MALDIDDEVAAAKKDFVFAMKQAKAIFAANKWCCASCARDALMQLSAFSRKKNDVLYALKAERMSKVEFVHSINEGVVALNLYVSEMGAVEQYDLPNGLSVNMERPSLSC